MIYNVTLQPSREHHDDYVRGWIGPNYTFTALVFSYPSRFGIWGGRVSKLQIRLHGDVVVNYDRGWDVRPKGANRRYALAAVLHRFPDC